MRADVARGLIVGAAALVAAACEVGADRPFTIVPGPAVPSPMPTSVPLVWDSREELDIWVNNPVTRGPVAISLAGEGADGLIRIAPRRGVDGWVLRGPDLDAPQAVQAVRIRYKWAPDPSLSPTATRTFSVHGVLDTVNPPQSIAQAAASRTLPPASDWTMADFRPAAVGTLEVRYAYFQQFSSNPGIFEIDRIEFVR